jgi:hypothetical protein
MALGMTETRAVALLAGIQAACAALAALALAEKWAAPAAWGATIAVIGTLALGMLLGAPAAAPRAAEAR